MRRKGPKPKSKRLCKRKRKTDMNLVNLDANRMAATKIAFRLVGDLTTGSVLVSTPFL